MTPCMMDPRIEDPDLDNGINGEGSGRGPGGNRNIALSTHISAPVPGDHSFIFISF